MTRAWVCHICGSRGADSWVCTDCRKVAQLVHGLVNTPGTSGGMHVIVDGSHKPGSKLGGAGLVLVQGGVTGEFIAFCACSFLSPSSDHAEYQAVQRGLKWAPGVPVHTDAMTVALEFGRRGENVSWLPPGAAREPNHSFAHRLSVEGRLAHSPRKAV